MIDEAAFLVAGRIASFVDMRTAHLNINYKNIVPLKTSILIEGNMVSVEGRKYKVALKFTSSDRSGAPPFLVRICPAAFFLSLLSFFSRLCRGARIVHQYIWSHLDLRVRAGFVQWRSA